MALKAARQLRDLDAAVAILEHHLECSRAERICLNAFLAVCSEVCPPPRFAPLVRELAQSAHKASTATLCPDPALEVRKLPHN